MSINFAFAVQSKPTNPAKVLAVIKARMDSQIRVANALGSDIEGNGQFPLYQLLGYTSAESYCLARNKEYRLLYDILQEASK